MTSPTRDGGSIGRTPNHDCTAETALQLLLESTTADAQALRRAAATLSHELRTPLTTIYTGSKLLHRQASRSSDPVMREVSTAIEADAERLMRVVEDLIVATALPGEPRVEGEPVLLQRVLPAVARDERARSPRAKVELRIPSGLPAVRGDEAYVTQAVRNLVANALEFGPSSGPVVVEAVEQKDRVDVHVLDTGPGVPEADVPRLFRLFSHTRSTGERGGLGLGLFVCRRLIELMGGHVWLRARRGAGSDFGFSLPLYPADDR